MGIERSTVLRSNYIGYRLHEYRAGLHHPEPQQNGTVLGDGRAAVGAAEKLHGRIVAAATDRPAIRIICVQTPLFHIAVHVVKAPCIGRELRHPEGNRNLVPGIALHLPISLRIRFSGVVGRCGAGPAGILPLFLGGKPEMPARLMG